MFTLLALCRNVKFGQLACSKWKNLAAEANVIIVGCRSAHISIKLIKFYLKSKVYNVILIGSLIGTG